MEVHFLSHFVAFSGIFLVFFGLGSDVYFVFHQSRSQWERYIILLEKAEKTTGWEGQNEAENALRTSAKP